MYQIIQMDESDEMSVLFRQHNNATSGQQLVMYEEYIYRR